MDDSPLTNALSKLDALKDIMTVKRCFGDAYEFNGVQVIPVATVRGGGGGGGGEGNSPEAQGQGAGAGIGFGVNVRPIGMYLVKDGTVTWSPAIDVLRIILGGQLLGLVGILSLRRILLHQRRHRN